MGENNNPNNNNNNKTNKNVRRALGDVTNQLGNKEFSLVDRSPSSKTLSGRKRGAENSDDDDDSHFWKQVSLVVEKLENETRSAAKRPKVSPPNDVGLSPLRGGKTYRLQTGGGDRGDGGEVREGFGSTLDSIDLGENQLFRDVGNVGEQDRLEVGEECREECREEGIRDLCDVGESECNREELGTQVVSDNGKSVGGDSMTSSRSETSRFSDSLETRSFGLEKCVLLKGDGSSSLASDVDLIKNCCCSFCVKVAYMWSDLQCQDIKGRISTLTKSKKEASILARKHSVETSMSVAQGSSSTGPPLETNLLMLWKSLFLHMENNFAAESSQLQTNLAALKDIREDYKMNLEMINEMIPDTQPCSSEASDHTIN